LDSCELKKEEQEAGSALMIYVSGWKNCDSGRQAEACPRIVVGASPMLLKAAEQTRQKNVEAEERQQNNSLERVWCRAILSVRDDVRRTCLLAF